MSDWMLCVRISVSRVRIAAQASGVEPVACKAVAVGVGALGSQIVMNLVKGGFGNWTVIDEDELMPHNLARHALPSWNVGAPKAVAIAGLIDETSYGKTVSGDSRECASAG